MCLGKIVLSFSFTSVQLSRMFIPTHKRKDRQMSEKWTQKISIGDKLHKDLKIFCATNDYKITEVAQLAIRKFLLEHK